MCVIALVNTVRPSLETIQQAWEANSDGAGIAYRNGKGEVAWEKGLDLKGIIALCAKVPTPYVAHFRVASIGGVKPELTHPFPIELDAPLALSGKTKGRVLFHNGHWADWGAWCLKAAVGEKQPIPLGPWSDSRGMAWLCAIYGQGIAEFLKDQKLVLFGPNDVNIINTGWVKIDNIWYSNDYFVKRGYKYEKPVSWIYCRVTSCTRKDNLDDAGLCPLHTHQRSEPGGAQNPTPPFQGELVPLKVAEELLQQQKISKTLMKKIRKCYQLLESKDATESARARRDLVRHSLSATFAGRLG